jgi:hypothetical protein
VLNALAVGRQEGAVDTEEGLCDGETHMDWEDSLDIEPNGEDVGDEAPCWAIFDDMRLHETERCARTKGTSGALLKIVLQWHERYVGRKRERGRVDRRTVISSMGEFWTMISLSTFAIATGNSSPLCPLIPTTSITTSPHSKKSRTDEPAVRTLAKERENWRAVLRTFGKERNLEEGITTRKCTSREVMYSLVKELA